MKLYNCNNTVLWYIKYFGVPLAAGVTMYGLCCRITERKRRAALEGKVVVITGASSGIGEALAHIFYEHGSKVVLAARRKTELERVKQELLSKPLSSVTLEPVVLQLDLSNIEEIEPFVYKVYEVCGKIDILVNNGGVSHRGAILHSNMDVYTSIMSINYFGSVALTKAVLPKMVENKSGHIAFVSSVQGLIAIPDRSAYAASKHAMQAFADSLRAEMHQYNIDVTIFSPGYVKTAISVNAFTGSGDVHGVMDPTTAAGFTPEYTARKFVDAIVAKKKELILSQFLPRLGIFLRHAAPSIYFWSMARRANKTS